MSITKSYNKHTNTYYAYDTTYVWDDKRNKKVQKKTCIGQYDPKTGEIIPNAKRGRPQKSVPLDTSLEEKALNPYDNKEINSKLNAILEETQLIKTEFSKLYHRLEILENKVSQLKDTYSE